MTACVWPLGGIAAVLEPLLGPAEVTCAAGPTQARIALVIMAVAAVMAGLHLIWDAVLVRRPGIGRRQLANLLLLVATMLLGTAALRPELAGRAEAPPGQVIALVDLSESVTRDPAALTRGLDEAADAVEAGLSEPSPGDRSPPGSGRVIVFGRTAATVAVADRPAEMVSLLRSAAATAVADDASAGTAALQAALDAADDDEGAATVLLITDGHWSDIDGAGRVVARLQRRGIPVHVWPTGSDRAALGLVGADMAPVVQIGAEVPLRLVYVGDGAVGARLTVGRDGQPSSGGPLTIAPSDGWVPVRAAMRMVDRGMRFVRLDVERADGIRQSRRLYTLVVAPPRILVVGRGGWADALPADAYEVTRAQPGAALQPARFDVVVLDGVPADQLGAGEIDKLIGALAVGTGLLVVNGPGGPPDEEALLARYEEGPLGPYLPVSTDPRLALLEPPPRDVTLLIDISGSMGGWMPAVRAIGGQIIDQLRDQDRLQILWFNNRSGDLMRSAPATPAVRAAAHRALASLTTFGGTSAPTAALQRIAERQSNSCGLFFISDGVFDGRLHNPGCVTTVFEMTGRSSVRRRDFEQFGQVVPVARADRVGEIRMVFFEPEPRPEHFRAGAFVPAHVSGDPVLTPRLAVDGVAITYVRPEAEWISSHDTYPFDPVLAYREADGGTVGAFTGAIPDAWARVPDGQAAIAAMIDRLLAWRDRDRYLLSFDDRGTAVGLAVTVVDAQLDPVSVGALDIAVTTEEGETLPLRDVETDPALGHLAGEFDLPRRGDGTVRAQLVLSEAGRRPQRIPAVLPVAAADGPVAAAGERWVGDIDRRFLRDLARQTGGQVRPQQISFAAPTAIGRAQPLHLPLIAAAAVALVAGVASRGLRL